MSVAVYNGLYRGCTEVERYKIKQYAEGNYPGAEAWAFLTHEYSSERQTNASDLLHQLQTLQLVLGQAEAYIVEKLELRDQLFAISQPITAMSFNAYLINGIPEEWETFKTTMRGQIRSLSESDLIAYIKGEDKRLDIKSRADMVYAARAASKGRMPKTHTKSSSHQAGKDTAHCTYCNKVGHIAAKCWNKPPFYCPRCKTQGHNLQSCPDNGKERADNVNSANQTGKNKKEEEKSLMVHSSTQGDDEERIDYVLTSEQASSTKNSHTWILDSGATSHMTPNRRTFL